MTETNILKVISATGSRGANVAGVTGVIGHPTFDPQGPSMQWRTQNFSMEGSRRRRRRRGGGPTVERCGRGCAPPQKICSIFGWKYCILTHSVWLKYQQKFFCHVNGGSNPLTPLRYATASMRWNLEPCNNCYTITMGWRGREERKGMTPAIS